MTKVLQASSKSNTGPEELLFKLSFLLILHKRVNKIQNIYNWIKLLNEHQIRLNYICKIKKWNKNKMKPEGSQTQVTAYILQSGL